jgi:hypothetical protein
MDERGLAGMATRADFAQLRRQNFGQRCLVHEVTVEAIARQIERYDAAEATAVSELARHELDGDRQLDRLEALHRTVVDGFVGEEAEARLLADLVPVLHTWLPRFPGTAWPWQFEKAAMLEQIARLEATLARERAASLAPTARMLVGRIVAALARRFRAAG